jgi:purine-nucleoside phosphorylase
MKKAIIVAIAILGMGFASQAQSVNGVLVKDINVKHIEIVGTAKVLSTKVKVALHFGQHDKAFSNKDTQVADKNGKPITFNSMIDALNFFSANGYALHQAYAVSVGNSGTAVYHYLMIKEE